jgi:hypothetical protein
MPALDLTDCRPMLAARSLLANLERLAGRKLAPTH